MGAIAFLSARKTFPMPPNACRASRTPDLLTLRNLDFFAPRASKKSKAERSAVALDFGDRTYTPLEVTTGVSGESAKAHVDFIGCCLDDLFARTLHRAPSSRVFEVSNGNHMGRSAPSVAFGSAIWPNPEPPGG